MVWQGIKSEIMWIEASRVGYRECPGVFWVTGSNGSPLPGVRVECRIGELEWTFCGHTHDALHGQRHNFSQQSPVFHRVGKPVVWRFSKPGYAERTITRHMAGREFSPAVFAVALQPLECEAEACPIEIRHSRRDTRYSPPP